MKDKINSIIDYYKLCVKLKDTIRTGPLVWNINRSRVESVAEHIYGTQMLAIAIYYQFGYTLDLKKVIYMLAIHELEEIVIGDLVFETTSEDKLTRGKAATDSVLANLFGKEDISSLLDEFNAKVTEEARFAYHVDKLECDMQIKLYDEEECFDLSNQDNNPLMNNDDVTKFLESEGCLSGAWIEFDRSKYADDENFIAIIDYLKDNEI